MINNFEQIKKLLTFNSEDEFYFVQILQRKKDNPGNIHGSNNSSRLIKAYYIDSIKKLEKQQDEMIQLANLFNARVGINLNKRSYYKTAFNTLIKMSYQMQNKEFKYLYRSWNTACGVHYEDEEFVTNETTSKQVGDKIWLLDFDYKPINPDWYINIRGYLYALQPIMVDKIIDFIPSNKGVHVITTGFDSRKFSQDYPDVEIHKNNPTNLYIP